MTRNITIEKLIEDINSTTLREDYDENDFRPLKGNNWRDRKAYAQKKLRGRRISYVRRWIIYYWLGKGLDQGKSTRKLSARTLRIARQIYEIFAPLGRRQIAYTKHLKQDFLRHLSSRKVRMLMVEVERRVDSFMTEGNDRVESGKC